MLCAPMARHSGITARTAILCPHETRFYDAIGLGTFSSLPLIDFVELWMVRVNGPGVLDHRSRLK